MAEASLGQAEAGENREPVRAPFPAILVAAHLHLCSWEKPVTYAEVRVSLGRLGLSGHDTDEILAMIRKKLMKPRIHVRLHYMTEVHTRSHRSVRVSLIPLPSNLRLRITWCSSTRMRCTRR